jgi:hypothetical protein
MFESWEVLPLEVLLYLTPPVDEARLDQPIFIKDLKAERLYPLTYSGVKIHRPRKALAHKFRLVKGHPMKI